MSYHSVRYLHRSAGLQETLFWLSQPGVLDDVVHARQELDAGTTSSEDEIRAEFGVPRRLSR